MSENLYIMEFSRDEILLITIMAHTMIRKHPEHDVANRLLESLIQQTEFVKREASAHGVGILPAGLKHPTMAALTLELDYGYIVNALADGYYEG